jgi:endo-1,4-beta-xylanase
LGDGVRKGRLVASLLNPAFALCAVALLFGCGEEQDPGPGAGGSAGAGFGGASVSGGASGTAPSGGLGAGGSLSAGGSGAAQGQGGSGAGTSAGSTAPSTGGTNPAGGNQNGGSGGSDPGSGGANEGGAPDVGGSAGSSPADCPEATTLAEAGDCSGRLIGVALSTAHLAESDYATNALEFNYVTAENEMKWDSIQPSRGNFTFAAGDQIADFAQQNGMKLKGHTLVWYNQLPSWVSSITDADELRSVMTDHIQTVMQHYQGDVIAWDVVNEAWDPEDPTMLRDSVFTRVLGPSYIDEAFNAARAADPDAKLYYNDYGTDGLSTKANSVYEMVRDMKARGIPIDGVGLQMHWRSVGSTLTAEEVTQNIQRLGELGLEVVISEMDVQLCRGGTLEDQRVRYHDIVAACVSQPNCTAVTFWGITDKYSWLNDLDLGCTDGETPSPLLFDDNYQKKLAYSGVMDALLGR